MSQHHVIFLSQPVAEVDGLYKVEIIREGEWQYPKLPDGKFKITASDLDTFKDHFDRGIKGFMLPVNEEHDEKDVIGWLRKTEIGLNEAEKCKSLFGWFSAEDPDRKEKIDNGQLKFASAEINLAWSDPEDGGKKKKVLEGLALTNKPYVKRMSPIQKEDGAVLAVNLSEAAMETGGGVIALATAVAEAPVAPTAPEPAAPVPDEPDYEAAGARLAALAEQHFGKGFMGHSPASRLGGVNRFMTTTEAPYGFLSPKGLFIPNVGGAWHSTTAAHLVNGTLPEILEGNGEAGSSKQAVRLPQQQFRLDSDAMDTLQKLGFARVGSDGSRYHSVGWGWRQSPTPEQLRWIEENVPTDDLTWEHGAGQQGGSKAGLFNNVHGFKPPTNIRQFLSEYGVDKVPQATEEDLASLTKLPYNHELYFDRGEHGQNVPLSKIVPIRARQKGVLNANKIMAEIAAKGGGARREPVSVIPNGDDTFTLMDGNSTYANALHSGWPDIVARVFPTREEALAHEAAKKAAKEAAKASMEVPLSEVPSIPSDPMEVALSDIPRVELNAMQGYENIPPAGGDVELGGLGAAGVHHDSPMKGLSVEFEEIGTDSADGKPGQEVYLDVDSTLDESRRLEEAEAQALADAAHEAGLSRESADGCLRNYLHDTGKTAGGLLNSLAMMLDSEKVADPATAAKMILRNAGYDSSVSQGTSVDLAEGRAWTLADGDKLYLATSQANREYAQMMCMVPVKLGENNPDVDDAEFNAKHKRSSDGKFDGHGSVRNAQAKRPGNWAVASTQDGGGHFVGAGGAVLSAVQGYGVPDMFLNPAERQEFKANGFKEVVQVYPDDSEMAFWEVPPDYLDKFGIDNAAKSVTKQQVERLVDAAHRAVLRDPTGSGKAMLKANGMPTDPAGGLNYLRAKGPRAEMYAHIVSYPILNPIAKRFLDFDEVMKGKYRAIDLIRAYLMDKLPNEPAAKRDRKQPLAPVPGVPLKDYPWAPEYADTTPADLTALLAAAKGQLKKANGGFLDPDAAIDARRRLLTIANARPDLVIAAGMTKAQILREIAPPVQALGGERGVPRLEDTKLAYDKDQEALNKGVPDQFHWVGRSNLSTLGQVRWGGQDLAAFVKEVRYDGSTWWDEEHASNVLKENIGKVFMAYDSNLNYKNLTFVIKSLEEGVRGQYVPFSDTIFVEEDISLPTLAHEIAHAIDEDWGREFYPDKMEFVGPGETPAYKGLSSMGDALRLGLTKDGIPGDKLKWAKAFTEFVEDMQDRAEASSEYHLFPWEVFGRFGDWFVRWAQGDTSEYVADGGYRDAFRESDAHKFVKLLQWKAYIDAKYDPAAKQGVLGLSEHTDG